MGNRNGGGLATVGDVFTCGRRHQNTTAIYTTN